MTPHFGFIFHACWRMRVRGELWVNNPSLGFPLGNLFLKRFVLIESLIAHIKLSLFFSLTLQLPLVATFVVWYFDIVYDKNKFCKILRHDCSVNINQRQIEKWTCYWWIWDANIGETMCQFQFDKRVRKFNDVVLITYGNLKYLK